MTVPSGVRWVESLGAGLGLATLVAHASLAPRPAAAGLISLGASTVGTSWFSLVSVLATVTFLLAAPGCERFVTGRLGLSSASGRRVTGAIAGGLALPATAMLLDGLAFRCTAPTLAVIGMAGAGIVVAALAGPAMTRALISTSTCRAAAVVAIAAMALPAIAVAWWPGPAGDEPHYLLAAYSIYEDGDLDLARDHVDGDYRPFHPGYLSPHHKPGRVEGTRFSMHGLGYPLLLQPAFLLGSSLGARAVVLSARAMQIVGHGIFAVLLFLLIEAIAGRRAALAGALAATTLAPIVFAPLHLFPETTAMVLTCAAFVLLRRPAGTKRLLAAGGLLAVMPWVAIKLLPVAMVLAAIGVARAGEGGRLRVATLLAVPLIVTAALHGVFTWSLYGSVSPASIYLGADPGFGRQPGYGGSWAAYIADWRGAMRTGIGYVLDQKEGLLAVGPFWFLAAAGLPWMWRQRRADLISGVAIAASYVGPYALSQQLGGQSPPVRPLMAILWVMGPPLGVALSLAVRRRWVVVVSTAMLVASAAVTVHFALRPELLSHDYPVIASWTLRDLAPAGSGWWRAFPLWLSVREPRWAIAFAWAMAAALSSLALAWSARGSGPRASGTQDPDSSQESPSSRARETPWSGIDLRVAAIVLVIVSAVVLGSRATVVVSDRHVGAEIAPGVSAWVGETLPESAWAEPGSVWVSPGRPVEIVLLSDRPLEAARFIVRTLVDTEITFGVETFRRVETVTASSPFAIRVLLGSGWPWRGGHAYHAVLGAAAGAAPADLDPGNGDRRLLGANLRIEEVEAPPITRTGS